MKTETKKQYNQKVAKLIDDMNSFIDETMEKKPIVDRAMHCLRKYLNAGTKEERTKAHLYAKKLYKEFYGIEFVNAIDSLNASKKQHERII
jgi:hypothetical protein